MNVTPLAAAAALPAGIGALKLAQHTVEQRPFRNLWAKLTGPDSEGLAPPATDGTAAPQDFLQLVNQRLAAAGIDTSLRFEIFSDAAGSLQVGGNHPQQEEITQVLQNDPAIASAFHRLAASHQLAQAADRHRQFAEQYVHDPAGAASRLPQQAFDFSVVINGDEIEIA